jgi:hypothetical protein
MMPIMLAPRTRSLVAQPAARSIKIKVFATYAPGWPIVGAPRATQLSGSPIPECGEIDDAIPFNPQPEKRSPPTLSSIQIQSRSTRSSRSMLASIRPSVSSQISVPLR